MLLVVDATRACTLATLILALAGCTPATNDAWSEAPTPPSGPDRQPSLAVFAPPAERGWSPANRLAQVGAQLFFDPRLSSDGRESCGSCHQPERGFSSEHTIDGRDTPSLLNLAFIERFGERATLAERIRFGVEQHVGGHQPIANVVARLRGDSNYDERLAGVLEGGLNGDSLVAALTEFVSRLISSRSSFDAYLGGDLEALDESARRGLNLFRGRAGCVACHNGPMLSDGKYHRSCLDGRRMRRFLRTPSLREVAHTAPYLHDGTAATLSEVVRRHRSVCEAGAFVPSGRQIDDLRAFLGSLTGEVVEYYPVRLPSRRRMSEELQEEMDRIDVLMSRNLDAIQTAVTELSNPVLTAGVWTDIVHESRRIKAIARRLPYLFPPQHLHDLRPYYGYIDDLASAAEALERAAGGEVFDDAYGALSELNATCNRCHALYRPVPNRPI